LIPIRPDGSAIRAIVAARLRKQRITAAKQQTISLFADPGTAGDQDFRGEGDVVR